MQPDDEQVRLLAKTLITPSSEPLNLFRVLVRHPELMKRVNALGGLFMAHGSVSAREREMIILRVAWTTGCHYEYAQHVSIARRVGLSEWEITNLGRSLSGGTWDYGEAGILRFADEIIADGEVSDETWQLVSRSHDDSQMLELVMLVGYYQMLAAFLNTVRVPIEDGRPLLPIES